MSLRCDAAGLESGALEPLGEHREAFPDRRVPYGPPERVVPIVPAAILFDLANGGDKEWGETNPYPALGRAACAAAGQDFPLGNVGAGMGAKAGSLKGGLGSASAFDDDTGLKVGALVGANPFGEVVMPDGTFWAWPLELEGELGGRVPGRLGRPLSDGFPPGPPPVSNTVIAAVAVNLALGKAQAKRIAMMAQDGIARAVRPAHTPFDGDTVFAVATGDLDREVTPRLLAEAGALAADCLARAMARAVLASAPLGDKPSWRQVYGGAD